MLQIKNTLGGGKPEGLHAWKKSSVSYIDNITTIAGENYILGDAKSNTTVYYSNSYTIDEATGMYTLVNPQSTILEYGRNSLYSVEMVKSNYYIWGSTSSNKIYNTNASSTYSVYIHNSKGSVYLYAPTSSSNDYKYDIHSVKTEYTFLDYIVSDKETAYPDGGEKGGYWYEKVSEGIPPKMFGCSKMAIDNFVFASNDEIGTLNHSLGEKPKFAFLIFNGENVTGTPSRVYVAIGSAYIDKDGTSTFHFEQQGNTAGSGYGDFKETETTVTFSQPYIYYNVGEYTLITMA